MNSKFQKAITYGLFPVVFTLAMLWTIFALSNKVNHSIITASVAVTTVLVVAIFERILPKWDDWNIPKNDIKTDASHLLVSMLILPRLLEAFLIVAISFIAVKLSFIVSFDIWPHGLPLILQLVIAMLISQFGEYWVHRLAHEVPFLWRFHAVHHSPKRLYWLNAARFHPIDTMLSLSFALSPLILLGAGHEVLTMVTVWIIVHGLFQHCNIDIKLGPLNYIFSMAELHRWHHSLILEEANANYGNNILFWDIIFGTVYYPKDTEAGEQIGLADIKEFPENYFDQIKVPFNWKNIK